jgi:hypothetical protein
VETCAAVILVWGAIPDRKSDESDWAHILGPELAAAERVMSTHGFSFRPYLQDEEAIVAAQLEGRSWLQLLLKTLGVSESDERQIRKILEPYGVLYDLRALMEHAHELREGHDVHAHAEIAAAEAYRERLKGRSTYDFMTEDEYLDADLYRERLLKDIEGTE